MTLNIDFITDGRYPYAPLEVTLKNGNDFLRIKETLTRIGIESRHEKTLYQSCHILHKQGRYYIVHFKELFALDGKETDLVDNDLERRNRIAKLLEEWKLCEIVDRSVLDFLAPISQIKVISHREKSQWILKPKYSMYTKTNKGKHEKL